MIHLRRPPTVALTHTARHHGVAGSDRPAGVSVPEGGEQSDASPNPGMPTISRFFGITIAMYFKDHGPPHFHAWHAQGSAKIGIDDLAVLESSLGRRQLRLVLTWAGQHQVELMENWKRARAGGKLQPIEPLQ
jgi:hypothetical protein